MKPLLIVAFDGALLFLLLSLIRTARRSTTLRQMPPVAPVKRAEYPAQILPLRAVRSLLWIGIYVSAPLCILGAIKILGRHSHDGQVQFAIALVFAAFAMLPPFTFCCWTGTLREKINKLHCGHTGDPLPLIGSRWKFF
jgi:hypothetical protein